MLSKNISIYIYIKICFSFSFSNAAAENMTQSLPSAPPSLSCSSPRFPTLHLGTGQAPTFKRKRNIAIHPSKERHNQTNTTACATPSPLRMISVQNINCIFNKTVFEVACHCPFHTVSIPQSSRGYEYHYHNKATQQVVPGPRPVTHTVGSQAPAVRTNLSAIT